MADPIIDNLTYSDFKNFFYRDGFNYIPYDEWDILATYSIDDKIYYRDTKKIYKSLIGSNIGNQPLTHWQQYSLK